MPLRRKYAWLTSMFFASHRWQNYLMLPVFFHIWDSVQKVDVSDSPCMYLLKSIIILFYR